METLEKLVRISSKGQITLPKAVRDLLQTDVVRIVVEDGRVRIEPIKDVAGSLKRYARGYVPLEKIRDRAWQEALREKYVRR